MAAYQYTIIPSDPEELEKKPAKSRDLAVEEEYIRRTNSKKFDWAVPEPPEASWPLHPSCGLFKMWNPIMLATVALDCFLQPMTCVFIFESSATSAHLMRKMNLVVWYLYLVDSSLQFIAQRPRLDGCGMERTLCGIAFMYLNSRQFLWEILSIVPWTFLYESYSPEKIEPGRGTRTMLLIVFLFMRLIRLARLSTIPRLFHIWRNKIHISFVVRTVAELGCGFFLLVHCLACFWSVIGLANPLGKETWLELYWDGEPPSECWPIYLASCYWAVATVTSIGYGDLVPQSANMAEVGSGICLIIMAASGWSVVIANAVKLVNEVHEDTEEYRKTLDTCESLFKRQKDIDRTLRHQIREYFLKYFELKKTQNSRELMKKMSPNLQRTVVKKVYRNWIEDVPWIAEMSDSCLVSLVMKMEQCIYIPREYIADARITNFVELGAVFIAGRVLHKGDSWGIDMTINGSTRRKECGWALNFVSTLSLSRRHLDDVLEDFKEDAWNVKRISCWMALRRKIKLLAAEELRRRSNGANPRRGFFERLATSKTHTYDPEYFALTDDSRYLLKNMRKDFRAVQEKQEAAEALAAQSRADIVSKLMHVESAFGNLESHVHNLTMQQQAQQRQIDEMMGGLNLLNEKRQACGSTPSRKMSFNRTIT